jgi:hypothetical protein
VNESKNRPGASSTEEDRKEVEANRFSAELLMPRACVSTGRSMVSVVVRGWGHRDKFQSASWLQGISGQKELLLRSFAHFRG